MLDYSFTDIETIKVFTQEDLPRGKSLDKPIWDKVVKNGDGIITEFLGFIGDTIDAYNIGSAVTSIGNKKINFVNHSDPEQMMLNMSQRHTIFEYGKKEWSDLGIFVNIEHWLDKRKFELMRETWEEWESYEGNETRTLNAINQNNRPFSTVDRLDTAVIIPYHLQRHAASSKLKHFNYFIDWYVKSSDSQRREVDRVIASDPKKYGKCMW